MKERKSEEFEFYDEKDGSGQKIVRVKRISRLDNEKLGEKIFDVISVKGKYKQLIVFWNAVSQLWDCELRTEIVPLKQTWFEERKELFDPVSFEWKDEKYWIIKQNEELDNMKWKIKVKKIKAIMQVALGAKEKLEPGVENW